MMSDDDGKRDPAARMVAPAASEPKTGLRQLQQYFHSGPERPGVLLPRLRPDSLPTKESLRRNRPDAAQSGPMAGLEAGRASEHRREGRCPWAGPGAGPGARRAPSPSTYKRSSGEADLLEVGHE